MRCGGDGRHMVGSLVTTLDYVPSYYFAFFDDNSTEGSAYCHRYSLKPHHAAFIYLFILPSSDLKFFKNFGGSFADRTAFGAAPVPTHHKQTK